MIETNSTHVCRWLGAGILIASAAASRAAGQAPEFTQEPASVTACTSESAVFQVEVNFAGENPSFQWEYNDGGGGVDVNDGDRGGRVSIVDDFGDPLQATSILTITTLDRATDAGGYRCVASDDNGSTPSQAAVLVVNDPVAATASADDPTICVGDNSRVRANPAGGDGDYTFAWSIDPESPNVDPSQFSNPSSQTPLFTPNSSGTYVLRVEVDDGNCEAASETVEVLVHEAPGAEPTVETETICVADTTSLTANPVGSGDFVFLWSVLSGPNSDPSQFSDSGAENPDFTPTDSGSYVLEVLLDDLFCNQLATGTVDVEVNALVSADPTPALSTICLGDDLTLSSNPSGGDEDYLFTWSVAAGPDLDVAQFDDATQADPVFTPSQVTDGSPYTLQVVVDDESCPPSEAASLTVNVNAATTAGPTADPETIAFGASTTVSANPAGGDSGYVFTWTIASGPDVSADQFDDPTAESTEFTPTAEGEYQLSVVVDDQVCASVLEDLTVEVTAGVSASPSADPDLLCFEAEAINLSANALGGDGTYVFTWSVESGPDTEVGQISDPAAENPVFTPSVAGAYTLGVEVDDEELPPISGQVGVSAVAATATIDTQPEDQSACEGDDAVFSITASPSLGEELSYQWRLDGVDVAGGRNATLTVSGVTNEDLGEYTCVVTNVCGDVESDGAQLSLLPLLDLEPLLTVARNPCPGGICEPVFLLEVEARCVIDGVIGDIGDMGEAVARVTGLASDPTTRVLYAAVRTSRNSRSSLATVNPATGAATIIESMDEMISDIAFHPDGTLYGVRGNQSEVLQGEIVTVDLNDASLSSLDPQVSFGDEEGHSITFDSDGLLYHHGRQPGNYSHLNSVDVTTGEVTLLHNYASNPEWRSMAIHSSGLFVASTQAGELWSIDPVTYEETVLGQVAAEGDEIISLTGMTFSFASIDPVFSLKALDDPDPVTAGAELTYTLSATNLGLLPATAVVLSDETPLMTTFVSGQFLDGRTGLMFEPDPGETGTITFDFDDPLEAGATFRAEVIVSVDSDVADQTLLHHDIFQADSLETEVVTADDETTLVRAVALSGTLTVEPIPPAGPEIQPGDTLGLTTTIGNSGLNADDVQIVIPIDPNATVVPGSVETTLGDINSEDPVDVTFGSMDENTPAAVVTFEVTVNEATPTGTGICHQGTISGTDVADVLTDDPDLPGSEDETCVTVCGLGDFECDGDVDLLDYEVFQLCFRGPDLPPLFDECLIFDGDDDGDIDLLDWATLQLVFTGM